MAKENKKDDSHNLPACVTDFIKQVIKKMRYRQKVRLDVQAELEAHFADELKNCEEKEREQKARQLLTEFGDVKMLAILLRRAKKRCRPLWRTVVARSFQALGVLILCFIIYIVWLLSGRPVITTNYLAEFNKIVRPVADESQNAAPLYNEAARLYKKVSDDFILFFAENHQAAIDDKDRLRIKELMKDVDEFFLKRDDPSFAQDINDIKEDVSEAVSGLIRKDLDELTTEQKIIAKRWIEEQQDVLELVVEGSRKPHYWQAYTSAPENKNEMRSVLLPDLHLFRGIVSTLRFRALFLAERGQYKDAFSDTLSCYRLGQNIRGAKTIIEQLVGIAIEALSVQAVRDILGEYEIDSAILAELQHDFEKIIADENYAIDFTAERLYLYDEIQRCFTSNGFGGGHLYVRRFKQIDGENGIRDYYGDGIEYKILEFCIATPIAIFNPSKKKTLASANEYLDYLDKLSRKSFAQLHAEEQIIQNKIDGIISGNLFLRVLIPAGRRVIEISNRIPTEVGATLAMVAITRYKQDMGEYPKDLNELVTTDYLSELPIDSFGDKPLVYRRTDNDFILYSTGTNCVDDDGRPSTYRNGRISMWMDNGDAVFWPSQEE
jgi:hypothetical protein